MLTRRHRYGRTLPRQAPDTGWGLLAMALPYLPTGFGASAADTTVSGARANLFFDTVLGSDSNSGASAASPKRTPFGASDTKSLLAIRGSAPPSTLTIDQTTTNTAISIANSGAIFAPYDRTTGLEHTAQPVPFGLNYLGRMPTAQEINDNYFWLTANGNSLTVSQLASTTCRLIDVAADYATRPIIRGAYLTGSASSAIVSYGKLRVEDCVIRDNWCQVAFGDNNPLGTAIRMAVGSIPGISLARSFIERTGTDTYYEVIGDGCYDLSIRDCLIRKGGYNVRRHDTHTDGVQATNYPGNYLLQRVIWEQIMYDSTTPPYVAGDTPQASIWQNGGTSTVTARTGGLMKDCILLGNTTLINAPPQGGQVRDHCLGFLMRHDLPGNVSMLNHNNTDGVDNNCTWVYANPASSGDQIYSGTVPTGTGTTLIRGI